MRTPKRKDARGADPGAESFGKQAVAVTAVFLSNVPLRFAQERDGNLDPLCTDQKGGSL